MAYETDEQYREAGYTPMSKETLDKLWLENQADLAANRSNSWEVAKMEVLLKLEYDRRGWSHPA